MPGWSPVSTAGQDGHAVKSRWDNVILKGPGQPAQCSNDQYADWPDMSHLTAEHVRQHRVRSPREANRTRPDLPAPGGNAQYVDCLATHHPTAVHVRQHGVCTPLEVNRTSFREDVLQACAF